MYCVIRLQVPSGFIKCWLEADDKYLTASRDDPGGAELMVPINIPEIGKFLDKVFSTHKQNTW